MSASAGWLSRLKKGLSRSSERLRTPLIALLKRPKLSASTFEELEEILVQSDMGLATAAELTQRVKKERWAEGDNSEAVLQFLQQAIAQKLQPFEADLTPQQGQRPWVCVLVGVNGSGKTTTVGKLAALWAKQGLRVGLVAADTFRAAAQDQLAVWCQRAEAHFYSGPHGCDAAGLAFESLRDAIKKNLDVLLIDTAGRLHNKTQLMDELSKMMKVLGKQDATCPHCVVLVLDGTVGQNAIAQVEVFQKATPLSGLILTKLDGSAKGGIVLDLTQRFQLPIYAIGVGEGLEDLHPFRAEAFAAALLGLG